MESVECDVEQRVCAGMYYLITHLPGMATLYGLDAVWFDESP